jgi:monooxygenase
VVDGAGAVDGRGGNHFSPRNNPWDQRLCLVPDGDLFAAIRGGRASIMTGDIDTFTETGVALSSGTELSADLIVTTTGLNMLALGGMEIVVDGCQVDLGKTVSYQGRDVQRHPEPRRGHGLHQRLVDAEV